MSLCVARASAVGDLLRVVARLRRASPAFQAESVGEAHDAVAGLVQDLLACVGVADEAGQDGVEQVTGSRESEVLGAEGVGEPHVGGDGGRQGAHVGEQGVAMQEAVEGWHAVPVDRLRLALAGRDGLSDVVVRC